MEKYLRAAGERLGACPGVAGVTARAVTESWLDQSAPLRGSFFRNCPSFDEAREVAASRGLGEYVAGMMGVGDSDVSGTLSRMDGSGVASEIFAEAKEVMMACVSMFDRLSPSTAGRLRRRAP